MLDQFSGAHVFKAGSNITAANDSLDEQESARAIQYVCRTNGIQKMPKIWMLGAA